MIIDLCFASGDLRIRTRSTPALRHAVELARAVLALGDDGHLTVRKSATRLSQIEFEADYSSRDAIEELLRFCTLFGLAELVRRVQRDAKLPPRQRRRLIRAIAPTLVVGFGEQLAARRFPRDRHGRHVGKARTPRKCREGITGARCGELTTNQHDDPLPPYLQNVRTRPGVPNELPANLSR